MIEVSLRHAQLLGCNDRQPVFRCPITGFPCEGDLCHLCEEYGCVRKAGLSPRSDENFGLSASEVLRPNRRLVD